MLAYVGEIYPLEGCKVERPFYPGGDYEAEIEKYDERTVVVDNPPFSILAKIARNYIANGVKFFLFAPQLTSLNFGIMPVSVLTTDANVIYENGANVNTAFITNLFPEPIISTCPRLRSMIVDAQASIEKKTLPKYDYPRNVLNIARISRIASQGVDFTIRRNDCAFIRALDSQRKKGKVIFGSGFLISDDKAKEMSEALEEAREPVTVWELSEGEIEIIKQLGK